MDKGSDKGVILGDRIVWQMIKDKDPKPFKLADIRLSNILEINNKKKKLYAGVLESDRIYQNLEKEISPYAISKYSEIARKCYENAGVKNIPFRNVEEWKTYCDNSGRWRSQYKEIQAVEVSNFGRVRFVMKNGDTEIQKQVDKDGDKGYLHLDGNYPEFPVVYQMVAETWMIKDGNQDVTLGVWHVHHISNNGYDNRPENLIWLRSSIHLGYVHKDW